MLKIKKKMIFSLIFDALTVVNMKIRNPRAGAALQWWLCRSYERRDGVSQNKVVT